MRITPLKKQVFLLVVLWTIPVCLAAQDRGTRNSLFIEPGFRAGPVLGIYPNLPELGLAWSVDVNVGWQTEGRQYWNQPMRFPQVGVLLSFSELGNPEVLGQEISVVPNLAYTFVQFGKFDLRGFAGLGFAWFNKPHDRISNPDNKLIGSHLTNKTIIGLNLDYTLDAQFTFSAGLSYLHYSNGHYQLPNLGINIPALRVGVKYFPQGRPREFPEADSSELPVKKWLVNLRLGLGAHEFGDPVKPLGGPKYPVYSGSVYVTRRLGMILNLHAGIHLNYYTSFHDYLAYHDLHQEDRHWRSVSIVAFGGIEVLMGHFGFTTQMGTYLYNPTYDEIHELTADNTKSFKQKAKKYLSYKFGATYYLLSTRKTTRFNPWAGIFLKSNAGQADFVEISVGCAF